MSVVYEIKSAAWWKAASWRALRTGISVLIPMLAATTLIELDWALAGSTIGLSIVASYLTSLAGLKELTAQTVPKWLAIAVRAIKQFAQTAVGFIGASLLITEVDWKSLALLSAGAAVTTVLQGVITVLPETEPVITDVPAATEDEPEFVAEEATDGELTDPNYEGKHAADEEGFTDRIA